jgi:hypothetical protein
MHDMRVNKLQQECTQQGIVSSQEIVLLLARFHLSGVSHPRS